MNELFRFVAIAPVQKKLPVFVLRLALVTSPLIVDLFSARASENPRRTMIQVANNFKDTEGFISKPEELTLFNSLTQFGDAVIGEEQIDLEALDQRVIDAFGQNAQSVRISQEFQSHKRMLSDSIIAIMIAPVTDVSLLAELSRLIRLLDLVERIAVREEALVIPGALDSVLSEALIIPPNLFPLPPEVASVPEPEEDPEAAARQQEINELQAKASSLRKAIKQLLTISPRDLRQTPAEPLSPESVPPLFPRRSRSFFDRLLLRVAPSQGRGVQSDLAPPPDVSRESQLLRPEIITRFSPEIRSLLQEVGADLAETSVPTALARLESELMSVGNRLAMIKPIATSRSVVRIGSTFVPVQASLPASSLDFAAPEGSGVPETVGSVRPVGVGRLLRVLEQIKYYEAGKIAHIENVLEGEAKNRGTRRFRRDEENFTVITETIAEEERDLITNNRFLLGQETVKTIQQDESFNVGVSISAGYGPYFQINSNFGFSSATSTTDTAKKAFSYAKDVTERSASRVSERIRREETIRTIEEFEETNSHILDNADGDDNITGTYQFVDEVSEVQIFDFGLRTLFDFMVPEPSAFLLKALENNPSETDNLEEPETFNERPDEINETNYGEYVLKYQVTGVAPPPPATITISRTYDASAETVGADFTKSEQVEIPDGYYTWQAHAIAQFVRWTTYDGSLDGEPIPETVPRIDVHIGREYWRRNHSQSNTRTLTLDNERGALPIAVTTLFVASYAVTIEIECLRDDRLLEKWRLDTHAAIMQAYLKLKSDYEEKLAAAVAQQGIEIEGRNPLENRLIERAELKKHCISLLTAQHFDLFGSILESPGTFPRIDFDEAAAEGRYIRFFEQAFEWENMTYVFYPYFWGRKSKWLDRILLRDIDPVHAEFLKSGAARAVAPVRPGFESAVLHFLDTGNIWEGGDLPEIGNPLYVDILEEIKERLQAPGDEIPVGEPWEIRLPTTLVRLRPDSTLPRWEKDEEGNWRAVESLPEES
jgi:hypothetical protein